jgi:hypothetical protein
LIRIAFSPEDLFTNAKNGFSLRSKTSLKKENLIIMQILGNFREFKSAPSRDTNMIEKKKLPVTANASKF